MKRTGKGKPLSINEPNRCDTSKGNEPRADAPMVRKFKPLSCWPVAPHPRQADLDAYRALPSRTAA